jgi:alpha-1,6-mannosyltransferase
MLSATVFVMKWLAQLRAGFWILATLYIVACFAALTFLQHGSVQAYVIVFGLLMALYGVAAWCLFKGTLHRPGAEAKALAAILVIAALLRGIALPAPQVLSSDAYRYVWDGRVQAAHVNPYRYIPADPALRSLRDTAIYPNINRADYAHTIYPPTAQLAFFAIEQISDGIPAMKLGLLLFDGLIIACLIALLRHHGLPATHVLLYAWHPLPIWEFAGAGHVDSIAIALLLLAYLFFARRASTFTGIALAAATLVKYYPVVAAPALYRRWDWRMPVAFVMTLALLYLPYMRVGVDVSGFLSGYATEEGLRDGGGIWLLSLLKSLFSVPTDSWRLFVPIATALMLVLSLWVQVSGKYRENRDVSGGLLLASSFTVLVSPHYPWYFTWLVPFLCFQFSPAHLWLTGSCALMYLWTDPTGVATQSVKSVMYVPFLLLVLVQLGLKRRMNSPEASYEDRSVRPASIL